MGILEEVIATNKVLAEQLAELSVAVNKGLPTKACYSYASCTRMLDGVSEQTVRRLVARGQLQLVEGLGKKPRVTRDSFWKFVNSRQMLRELKLIEAERAKSAGKLIDVSTVDQRRFLNVGQG